MFWKCRHPARYLGVAKQETTEPIDEDFYSVTYHLVCYKCGEKIELQYALTVGGVDEFLTRKQS